MSHFLSVKAGLRTFFVLWGVIGVASVLLAETERPFVYSAQTPAGAVARSGTGVPGRFKPPTPARGGATAAAPLGPAMGTAAVQQRVSLLPLSPALVAALEAQSAQEPNSRFQIGLGRLLDKPIVVNGNTIPGSEWQRYPNGWRTWSVEVGSPGALGLRLHLERLALPNGARLVIYDPARPATKVLSINAQTVAEEPELWTSTCFCDRLMVECQVPPREDPQSVAFVLSGFSHIYTLPRSGSFEKVGACNNDVTCSPAAAQAASGVARMAFVDGGNTYLCTGCLVAGTDPNHLADYFLTANHCVGSQRVASTLELFWFYQTSSCNGVAPSLASGPMTSGGADLLATSPSSDYTLLRLRQSPPAGAFFLGWSLTPPANGETLTGIHHPGGSYKRISFGHLIGANSSFFGVKWFSGVTEPGSSGSPLLNASLQVIGQLNGGYGGPGSSCATPSAPDQYGRLDAAYSALQPWLGGGGGAVVTPLKGSYQGLFADAGSGVSPQSAGAVAITVTARGKLSGSLVLGTRRYSFAGQFDASGSVQRILPRSGQAPLALQLQVDPADADHLTGSVSDGTFSAALSAHRAVYDGKFNRAPQAGRYTLILPGNYGSATQPGGDSCGVLTVSQAGLIQCSATLADGVAISQSARVSKEGLWPVYRSLYGGQGLLFGWVSFARAQASDLGGSLTWIRPSLPKARMYAGGFSRQTTAVGSLYRPPAAGGSILDLPTGQVNLSGAHLEQSIINQIALRNNNRVINLSENRLNLAFALPTGTFRGGVIDPQTGKTIAFRGVVLQKQNIACGFFMSTDQSGEVIIAAP